VGPFAFEQGMNVIHFLDILRLTAFSSAQQTKVFVGKSLQTRPLSSALYTCFLEFSHKKRSTAETSEDSFSPAVVRKRVPNHFLNLSSHPSLALRSSFFIIIL
jgi:hypothetical protein